MFRGKHCSLKGNSWSVQFHQSAVQTERRDWRVFCDDGVSDVGQGQYKMSIQSFFVVLFADYYRCVGFFLFDWGFLFVLVNISQPVIF